MLFPQSQQNLLTHCLVLGEVLETLAKVALALPSLAQKRSVNTCGTGLDTYWWHHGRGNVQGSGGVMFVKLSKKNYSIIRISRIGGYANRTEGETVGATRKNPLQFRTTLHFPRHSKNTSIP